EGPGRAVRRRRWPRAARARHLPRPAIGKPSLRRSSALLYRLSRDQEGLRSNRNAELRPVIRLSTKGCFTDRMPTAVPCDGGTAEKRETERSEEATLLAAARASVWRPSGPGRQ